MARPRKEFTDKDWDTLERICQFKIPIEDAAAILDVHKDTLTNRIRERYDISYSAYREQKMAKTRLNLWSKQVEVALKGNVSMLIWLGKNFLGQSDKTESTVKDDRTPVIFDLSGNFKPGDKDESTGQGLSNGSCQDTPAIPTKDS